MRKGKLLCYLFVALLSFGLGYTDKSILPACFAVIVILVSDQITARMTSAVNRFICFGFAAVLLFLLLDDVRIILVCLAGYVVLVAFQIYAHVRKKNEENFSDSFTEDHEEQDKL